MILKTLTLKNFRKFKNTTIEFPDGVTGIVGLNGVGKSTIFEAIAWVLYGSVAARTSADQIKREGAETTEPCRVELDFIFEDNAYRIVREMSGKSLTASATATINGKIAATGAEVVSKYIHKKLGMDFKSFFTSIFARQKELNALSSMNASERRPLILRMLGIDSLDDVIKEIKSDKRTGDVLIEKLESDLIDENGKNRIEKYKEEIKHQKIKKEQINLSIKKSKTKIQTFNKELKNLEKDYIASKNEYEKINLKREKLSEEKTQHENKMKLQDEIKKLQNKITERQKNIEKQTKKAKSFENLDKNLKEAENRLNKIDKNLEKSIKTIEQKKTLVERIKKDIKEIERKENKIKKMGPDAKCPTCERVLSNQHGKLLKKFKYEIIKNEKEIDLFLKQIEKENTEKEKFVREEQALDKKRNYLQNQIKEKERIITTIENLSKEMKSEKTEIEHKKILLKKITSVKFVLKEFETVKKQVDIFYKKYQESLEKLNIKKDDSNLLKIDLEKKEGDEKLISQEIKNISEKIDELNEFKKRIKDEKKTMQYLGMLNEIMSSFRIHLISRVRPILSAYASDFFDRLTNSRYNEIELDENYNLMVYDEGKLYNIERFSGGEEDLANLCIRLAISEVITERAGGIFNFIILDEIFGSQDAIRRHNIMKALNGLSSKFRQIFLITHIDELKNDMENVIYVSENEDGISTAKIE